MADNNLFYGERVRLTALRPDDVATVTRWYDDGDFARMFQSSPAFPRSEAAIRRWIEDASRSSDHAYAFAIRLLYSDDMIGYIEIDEIRWNHRSAWLAIGIGDAAHRGKGYGYEAMLLVLRFVFHEINLHRVQLNVFSYNAHAQRLYERLGFQREGVWREALLRDGVYHDLILYGLLAHEWEASFNLK